MWAIYRKPSVNHNPKHFSSINIRMTPASSYKITESHFSYKTNNIKTHFSYKINHAKLHFSYKMFRFQQNHVFLSDYS